MPKKKKKKRRLRRWGRRLSALVILLPSLAAAYANLTDRTDVRIVVYNDVGSGVREPAPVRGVCLAEP